MYRKHSKRDGAVLGSAEMVIRPLAAMPPRLLAARWFRAGLSRGVRRAPSLRFFRVALLRNARSMKKQCYVYESWGWRSSPCLR
jgi:hypothetical protein